MRITEAHAASLDRASPIGIKAVAKERSPKVPYRGPPIFLTSGLDWRFDRRCDRPARRSLRRLPFVAGREKPEGATCPAPLYPRHPALDRASTLGRDVRKERVGDRHRLAGIYPSSGGSDPVLQPHEAAFATVERLKPASVRPPCGICIGHKASNGNGSKDQEDPEGITAG